MLHYVECNISFLYHCLSTRYKLYPTFKEIITFIHFWYNSITLSKSDSTKLCKIVKLLIYTYFFIQNQKNIQRFSATSINQYHCDWECGVDIEKNF